MLPPDILKKLESIEARYEELTHSLSDPATASSGDRYKKVAKERASVEPTVNALRAYRKTQKEIADNEALLQESDAEMRQMAKEELASLRARVGGEEEALKLLLVPKDPNDE